MRSSEGTYPRSSSHTKAPLMRVRADALRRVVKRDLAIQFVPQPLTSYNGLELLRRYLRRLALPARLRAACTGLGGDYGSGELARVVMALISVGARRLGHLRYRVGTCCGFGP